MPGQRPGAYILPASNPPLGGLHRRPSAYVRWDGVTAVVYVGFDDSIHQLALMNNGWVDLVIPVPGVIQKSQLFASRVNPNRNSILFRGLSNGPRTASSSRCPPAVNGSCKSSDLIERAPRAAQCPQIPRRRAPTNSERFPVPGAGLEPASRFRGSGF